MRPRIHSRAAGASLPGLFFALLASLSLTGESAADERVLRVEDGSDVRHYAVPALAEAVGRTELRVAQDPHFGPDRVFEGFALGPLREHVGLGDAPEVLLGCADGYRIPFDTSTLSKRPVQGLLAIRDTALPAEGENRWLPYRHGAESISFDPFYLVWAGADENVDVGTGKLPWPFQVVEILRFDREAYFAPARPPDGADEGERQGFAIYTARCAKCHRMRGVGGDVGPALDRDGSLSSIFTTEQLRDYVRHDESRFPQSKMPQFSKILSPPQIDQVVYYLQTMQPARP